ncbi:MAG: mannose-6-phosphate isomerase, class I [Desulfobacteraceae bacterium]|nr:MAG: mannose-6-phosphate isomerase, class I [Desulfobacteraceae bacterium]
MKTAVSLYNMNQPFKLKNPIQTYAWGSHSAIQQVMGIPPTTDPWAELWMGAHPIAPSQVYTHNDWVSLDSFIRQSPEQMLGEKTAQKYQKTLPYLFKLLAAEKPLSIQAHPDRRQAENGFDRENRLGIKLDSPNRNYRDPRHKPECICALTPFTGLKGFRKIDDMASLLSALCPESLADELDILRTKGLKFFFHSLMAIPIEKKKAVIRETIKTAKEQAAANPIFQWILTLYLHYPEDIGILSPAILNLFRLAPGEALFLPAGELHAYLDGLGIELMANSDNVLRGGLTPKHIDVPELMNILNFNESTVSILYPERISDFEDRYPVLAEEFSLSVINITNAAFFSSSEHKSPEIVLCTQGKADLSCDNPTVFIHLNAGDAAFIPACVDRYKIIGDARIYKAGVPV